MEREEARPQLLLKALHNLSDLASCRMKGQSTIFNNLKFNKNKCRIMHLGCGNPSLMYRLGDRRLKSSPSEKGSGVLPSAASRVRGGTDPLCSALRSLTSSTV